MCTHSFKGNHVMLELDSDAQAAPTSLTTSPNIFSDSLSKTLSGPSRATCSVMMGFPRAFPLLMSALRPQGLYWRCTNACTNAFARLLLLSFIMA